MKTQLNLHQAAWKHNNIVKATALVLTDAVFPNGFANFMEALVREGVVDEGYKRKDGAIGYRWCDDREMGGLLIETCHHPMLTDRAGTMIFEGIKDALEIAHATLNTHNVQYSKLEYK